MRGIKLSPVAYRCNVIDELQRRRGVVRLTDRGKERFAVLPRFSDAFAVISACDDAFHLAGKFYTRLFAETEFFGI